ncbi:hypothetical protein PCE1_004800 [Barthelona sp. PCE]
MEKGPHFLYVYILEGGKFILEKKKWMNAIKSYYTMEYIDEMTLLGSDFDEGWSIYRFNDDGEVISKWLIGHCAYHIIGNYVLAKRSTDNALIAHTLTIKDDGVCHLTSTELYRNARLLRKCSSTNCVVDVNYTGVGYARFIVQYLDGETFKSLDLLELFPVLSTCFTALVSLSFLKLSVSQKECVIMSWHLDSNMIVILKDEKINFSKVSCIRKLYMIPQEFSLEFDHLNMCKDMFYSLKGNIFKVNLFRSLSSIVLGVDFIKNDFFGCLSTSLLFTTRYGIFLIDLAARTCLYNKNNVLIENVEWFRTKGRHILFSSGECFSISQQRNGRFRDRVIDHIYNIGNFDLEEGIYPSICIHRRSDSIKFCPHVFMLDDGVVYINTPIEQGICCVLEYYDFVTNECYSLFSCDSKAFIEHVTEDIIIVVTDIYRLVFRRDSRTKWREEHRVEKGIFVNPFNTDLRVSFKDSFPEFTFADGKACVVETSSFITFVDAEIALFSDGIYFIGPESVKLVNLGEFAHFINAKGDFSIVPIRDLEKKIFSITRYHTSGSEIVETECFGTTVEDFFSSCSYHSMAGYFRDHHGMIDVEPTRVIDLCEITA